MNENGRSARPARDATVPELRLLMPETATHVGAVLGSAGVTHAALLLLLFLLVLLRPPMPQAITNVPRLIEPAEFVFLREPAAPGSRGGGGNRSPLPPRTAPTPAIRPMPAIVPEATPAPVEPEPIVMDVPEVPNTAPIAMLSNGAPVPGLSFGPGTAPGAGKGREGGIGDGGPRGAGRNGIDGVGNGPGCARGATSPVPLNRPRPNYTSEAMQRGMRGEATVSCIVTTRGEASGCAIVRSLDGNAFGLDDQALKAAAQFRFRPAMCADVPVPTRVNIVLEFNLR